MIARPRVATLLPRLAPHCSPAASFWNALGLLIVALAGGGLVHLLAYHIPLGIPVDAHWLAITTTLLARCPLSGPLGLLALGTVAVMLVVWRELRRLERLHATLNGRARLAAPTDGVEWLPRGPGRLVLFIAVLLGLQLAVSGVTDLLWPMQTTMVMGHGLMTMVMTPALPLLPLHALAAVVLGLSLWRVEHRLTRLRARVAAQLRLLLAACPPRDTALPLPTDSLLPWRREGAVLFARPPPSGVMA